MKKERKHEQQKKMFAGLLSALLCLCILAIPAFAQTKNPKSETEYYYNNGTWEKSSITTYSWNKDGTMKQMLYKSCTDDYTYKAVYGKKKTTIYDGGKLLSTTTHTYKKGLLTKDVIKYAEGGSSSTYKYTYNKKGQNTKITATGTDNFVETITYNKKGYKTKSVCKAAKYTSTSTYKYDKKGRSTGGTTVTKSADSTDTSSYQISYYTSGKAKGLQKTYKYTSNNFSYTETCTYPKIDKNGNPLEMIRTNSDGSKYKTVYKY